MDVTINQVDGGVVVRIGCDRLDAAQSIRFKDRLRDILSRHGPRIVLDLGQVQFMDSSGLGAILAIRRILPETHRIEVAALTPNVARVFRLTRMDSVFTIHDAAPAGTMVPGGPYPSPGAA